MPNIRSSSSKALAFALAIKNRPAAITPDIANRDVMVGLLRGKNGETGGNCRWAMCGSTRSFCCRAKPVLGSDPNPIYHCYRPRSRRRLANHHGFCQPRKIRHRDSLTVPVVMRPGGGQPWYLTDAQVIPGGRWRGIRKGATFAAFGPTWRASLAATAPQFSSRRSEVGSRKLTGKPSPC
jgi:hypothetical protein